MFFSKKLKKFKQINHCFFSKNGGVSKGIYKSLNCGKGSADDKKKILQNLLIVSKKIGVMPKNLKLMHQTHSNRVIVINKKNKNSKIFKSDSLITSIKSLAIGVVTADCVPIILYDSKNEVIGCVHAGWKGAISGIIEKTINQIKRLNKDSKIFACIGPCIGQKSYEVDANFYRKFLKKSKKNSLYFSKKNKTKKLFNLRKYVRNKLIKYRVKVDQIYLDTFAEKKYFFSYRRSQKLKEDDYGRNISVITLKA